MAETMKKRFLIAKRPPHPVVVDIPKMSLQQKAAYGHPQTVEMRSF
jgi:thiamine pyrophosphate-dependent acetolactate synthase large subunit-like protein